MTSLFQTIGIPLGFILLLCLILWFVIGSRGNWVAKMLVIITSLYLCIGIWWSTFDLLGWPAVDNLPDKFEIHWIVVKEPDKKTESKGEILVWTTRLDQEKYTWEKIFVPFAKRKNTQSPRAYRIEYSRELHEQSQQILQQLRAGERYVATMKSEEGKGKTKGKIEEGEKGEGKGSPDFSQQQVQQFYRLPPPKYPKKSS